MFTMMLGIRWEVSTCRIIRKYWQRHSIQKNGAIAGVGLHLTAGTAAAAAVHPPATIGIAATDGRAGSIGAYISPGIGFGVKATAARIGNGIIAREFTRSSQIYRKKDYDMENEHAIDKHFNNPLNKYLDPDENSEKSLEEVAREQKRKIQSVKRARAARDFSQRPEKRTLSWDTIQQIHYLRQENPDEWSIALLAESFNASEEVIAKVLRSKFRPSMKARQKQDLAAAENTGYVTGRATNSTQALLASGTASRPTNNKGKENKHTYKGTPGYVHEKVSQSKAGHNTTTVLKKSPSSNENQEHHMKKGKRDHQNSPLRNAHREGSEEELKKDPEVEFTFGDIDFENVDSLMGQVKLKPQVFRKGRNFYNENGEFLYRI